MVAEFRGYAAAEPGDRLMEGKKSLFRHQTVEFPRQIDAYQC